MANNCQGLNPELWAKLPQHLLETLLAKLPLPSLARFRAVSKRWKSVIIPNAFPRDQASSRSVLIYCDDGRLGPRSNRGPGDKCWFEVSNSKRSTRSWEPFQPPFFPSPSGGDGKLLVASDGGLLFYALKSSDVRTVWDLVVCNPLTRQSKILSLPRPVMLVPPCTTLIFNISSHMLVGAVVNAETGHYKLVVVGLYDASLFATQMYDSSTSSWKLLSSIQHGEANAVCLCTERSICYDGNLYWHVRYSRQDGRMQSTAVLKYDVQSELWSARTESRNGPCLIQPRISSEQGKVLLLHSDERPIHDLVHNELAPHVALLSERMIDELELSFDSCGASGDYEGFDYLGFAAKDIFYHVIYLWRDPDYNVVDEDMSGGFGVLRVLVQNANKRVKCITFQVESLRESFYVGNVWAFSPSLTALV